MKYNHFIMILKMNRKNIFLVVTFSISAYLIDRKVLFLNPKSRLINDKER